MEHLDNLAHSALGYPTAAKDIRGVVCDLLRAAGSVRLEEADRTAEVSSLLSIGHIAHLVSDGFQPGLVGFAERDHSSEPSING